eukprot:TRINITY_DN3182_c0_g1_i1.p4 TRINITY_DN3182_c0_g1~~TRINITY_DN3182_c0_g1_i1.p4  ORF type:complete len:103 (-),score=2.86 TRINITY_DN3182_c0_g1_i1:892-1161(-)
MHALQRLHAHCRGSENISTLADPGYEARGEFLGKIGKPQWGGVLTKQKFQPYQGNMYEQSMAFLRWGIEGKILPEPAPTVKAQLLFYLQ